MNRDLPQKLLFKSKFSLLLYGIIFLFPVFSWGQSPPINVTASSTCSSVLIKWSYVSGYSSYKIYRAPAGSTNFSPIGTTSNVTGSNNAQYEDSSVTQGSDYRYKVATCASASNCSSQLSNPISGSTSPPSVCGNTSPPNAPTNPSAQAISDTQIKLMWNAVAGATSYEVRRNGSFITSVPNSGSSTLSYTINNLQSNTSYTFNIYACAGGSNCSTASANVSATTAQGVPAIVNVYPGSASQMYVAFSTVQGASGYKVLYTGGTSGTLNAASSPAIISNLAYGTNYCFQVAAINNGIQSGYSSQVCGTTNTGSAGNPVYSAIPTSLSFGSVNVGNSLSKTLTITNGGAGYLDISSINLPNGFSITENIPTTINPNSSLNIDIIFTPTTITNYSGNIIVATPNANNGTSHTIAVNGVGIAPVGTTTSLSLTSPSSGATIQAGANYSIQWTSNNINAGNIKIELFNGATWAAIDLNAPNNGQYTWTVPIGLDVTNAKIRISWTNDLDISDESGNFTISSSTTTGACTYYDVATSSPYFAAATYLCNQGLLDDDNAAEPETPITRAALAKLVYLSLGLNSTTFANQLPTHYLDLQDASQWYYPYCKTLSYLDYDDCTSPFDRNRCEFLPGTSLSRAEALKVILEAWDIASQIATTPFTDISGHPLENYIAKANSLGIINTAYYGTQFQPDTPVKRGEVFDMLYQLMDGNLAQIPTIIDTDYFIPGNYTPINFSKGGRLIEGNFAHRETPSFVIPSIGLPLVFSHFYNSYHTELPNEMFVMKPMAIGWSHSYNAWAMKMDGDPNYNIPDKLLVMMPGGVFHVYNTQTMLPMTEGVYNTLSYDAYAATYSILTKGQITYTFQLPNNGVISNKTPYVLKTIKDRNNNTVSINYEYRSTNKKFVVKTVKGTAGRTLSFTYNGIGRLIGVSDPIGRTISFGYAANTYSDMDVASYTDPKGQTTMYGYLTTASTCYREDHLLTKVTLPKGNIIDAAYDIKRLKSLENNAGQKIEITIPSTSNASSILNRHIAITTDNTNTVEYDASIDGLGNIQSLEGGNNQLQISYHDGANKQNPTTVIANGTSISYEYYTSGVQKGNLKKVTYPNGTYESYTYDTENNPLTHRNGNGNITQYGYIAGRLNQVKDPMNGTTTFNRLNNGLVSSITNPTGIAQNFTYDNYGNVGQVTLPNGVNSKFVYDQIGRLTSTTDPNGNTMQYEYDANDNLAKEINALGAANGTTQYQYDTNDNLTTIINAMGNSTSMTYDANNDFLKAVAFGGAQDQYDYYDDGRIKSTTKPSGHTFNYAYDGYRRLINDGYAQYTYDNTDNLLKSVVNTDGTIQFTYDNMKRTKSMSYRGKTIQYEYDNIGNLIKLTYPDGKAVNYTFDANNRLKTVTDWNNQTTTYNYLSDGRLSSTVYPNGVTNTFDYDNLGRLKESESKKGSSLIFKYTITTDPIGNHTSEVCEAPFLTLSTFNNENISYNYNARNQILSAGGTSYTHDADGNMTQSGTTTLGYDNRDMLTTINASALNLEFKYDGLGNRTARIENGTETRYVLDLMGMSKILLEEDSGGATQNYYVYGLGLISRVKPNGDTRYYHYDYRGSTVAMTNEAGVITHDYCYDDFGYILSANEEDYNPFRYVGQHGVMYETDDFVFMRARYYNPNLGRFLSEDPIWHKNLYPYADNNPINNGDTRGTNATNFDEINACPAFPSSEKQEIKAFDSKKWVQITPLEAWMNVYENYENKRDELIDYSLSWGENKCEQAIAKRANSSNHKTSDTIKGLAVCTITPQNFELIGQCEGVINPIPNLSDIELTQPIEVIRKGAKKILKVEAIGNCYYSIYQHHNYE